MQKIKAIVIFLSLLLGATFLGALEHLNKEQQEQIKQIELSVTKAALNKNNPTEAYDRVIQVLTTQKLTQELIEKQLAVILENYDLSKLTEEEAKSFAFTLEFFVQNITQEILRLRNLQIQQTQFRHESQEIEEKEEFIEKYEHVTTQMEQFVAGVNVEDEKNKYKPFDYEDNFTDLYKKLIVKKTQNKKSLATGVQAILLNFYNILQDANQNYVDIVEKGLNFQTQQKLNQLISNIQILVTKNMFDILGKERFAKYLQVVEQLILQGNYPKDFFDVLEISKLSKDAQKFLMDPKNDTLFYQLINQNKLGLSTNHNLISDLKELTKQPEQKKSPEKKPEEKPDQKPEQKEEKKEQKIKIKEINTFKPIITPGLKLKEKIKEEDKIPETMEEIGEEELQKLQEQSEQQQKEQEEQQQQEPRKIKKKEEEKKKIEFDTNSPAYKLAKKILETELAGETINIKAKKARELGKSEKPNDFTMLIAQLEEPEREMLRVQVGLSLLYDVVEDNTTLNEKGHKILMPAEKYRAAVLSALGTLKLFLPEKLATTIKEFINKELIYSNSSTDIKNALTNVIQQSTVPSEVMMTLYNLIQQKVSDTNKARELYNRKVNYFLVPLLEEYFKKPKKKK